ncbi:MAG TPA: hypothetical protein VMP67_02240 [Candidatus Limnocylindria bacterium]|nr:hypothetical protein [Candidatus Limnocylindria bacterium]
MNEDLIARRIRLPMPAAPPTPAWPPAGRPQTEGSAPPFDRPIPLPAPAEDEYFVEPPEEFVSYAPPWDAPPDYEEWAAPDGWQPAAQAPQAEAQPLEAAQPAVWPAEADPDPHAQSEEPTEASVIEGPVDEIDRRFAGLELWSVPSAPESDESFASEGAGAVAGEDPDDSLAPLASDLLISQPEVTMDTLLLPERDLPAAGAVVAHEPVVEEVLVPADQPEQASQQPMASPPPITDRRRSGPSPIRYSSVFGDLFSRPPGTSPHRHPFAAAGSEAEAGLDTTASMVEEDPLEWPPVPTGLFRSRPELNVEAVTEGDLQIRWPDQPQAQIFWPEVVPPEPVSLPAPESEHELYPLAAPEAWSAPQAWSEPKPDSEQQLSSEPAFDGSSGSPAQAADSSPDPQPALPSTFDRSADQERAAWSLFVTADPRFDPDPLGRDMSSDPLRLIFSDPPPPPPAEPRPVASSDGAMGRLASQASALAERVPDNWGITRVPSVGSARDDALVHDLRDIPSPALTVVFAVAVIAAVLLFVYLVTPLLR